MKPDVIAAGVAALLSLLLLMILALNNASLQTKKEKASEPVAVATPRTTPRKEEERPLPTRLPAPAAAPGRFKVHYSEMRTEAHEECVAWLRKQGFPKNYADMLNELISLPKDVTISVTECIAEDGTDIINAYYWREHSRIDLCIGFFQTAVTFNFDGQNREAAFDKGYNVFQSTILHEVGHALVDVLNLPITGREEDVVDQFAVFILTNDNMPPMALNAADYFNQLALVNSETFYDEHSFSQQRFYNFTCWVYGQNPKRFSMLVDGGYLPEERAVRCEHEYKQIRTAWSKLLLPYAKEP